jgi:O-acetyl-ADP-ribose deacetylase (regulator of RNase III)
VKCVIHAVGPIYRNRIISRPVLAATYSYSLALARLNGLRRIAFPALSCGIFGFPHDLAADVATRTMARHSDGLQEVVMMIADKPHLVTWRKAARRVAARPPVGGAAGL